MSSKDPSGHSLLEGRIQAQWALRAAWGPRKGRPAITKSDVLVINKTGLAPHVGSSLNVMARHATRMRGDKPIVCTSLRNGVGADKVIGLLAGIGGFEDPAP